MFDVWSIVRWWDDWQLRTLVLGSLFLQWFLLLAAPMRKYTIPRVFRTCIWLAYVSSDALAIYALATLFNRHAKASPAGSCSGVNNGATASTSSILEVLWAPILLIHLGGQEELTAYEIEDNELWTRHTVTLVSQVAVALYAFYKSWPTSGDWKLLATAVLLFVIGVVSFSEKPWALNRAKIDRLAAVSAVIQGTKRRHKLREFLNNFFMFEGHNCFTELRRSLPTIGVDGDKKVALTDGDKVFMVLSDMSLSAAAAELVERGKAGSVEEVLGRLDPTAERALRRWLRGAFAFIYTRATVVFTPHYLLYHLMVVPALHVAALALFATSDKRPYKRTDVKVTYVLLCLTAALDVFAVFIRQLLYLLMSMTQVPALCETVPGYNLIDAVVQEEKKEIGWIYKCARKVGVKSEYLAWSGAELSALYKKVAGLVMSDLMKITGRDLAGYRKFTVEYVPPVLEVPVVPLDEDAGRSSISMVVIEEEDSMKSSSDNWALNKKLQQICSDEIRGCLNQSFDRSVLLWHIATDLCFRCTDIAAAGHGGATSSGAGEAAPPSRPPIKMISCWSWRLAFYKQEERLPTRLQLRIECTQAIANYMAHLLNFNPDMLLTGSRKHLITEAMREIKTYILEERKDMAKLTRFETIELVDKIARKAQAATDAAAAASSSDQGSKETDSQATLHIGNACKLAKELLEIPDEKKRWKLLYKVWLGMLCYSASMCRGYLHAKSLGEGGQFLSFVWLILALKGAKTLADKLQMPAKTEEDANKVPDSGAQGQDKDLFMRLKQKRRS